MRGELLQELVLGVPEEEVVPSDFLDVDRSVAVSGPVGHLLPPGLVVVGAAERRDGAAERSGAGRPVGVQDRVVRPDRRKVELHELLVLQEFLRRPAQLPQPLGELLVGEVVRALPRGREMRSGACRDQQANGRRVPLARDVPHELVGQDPAEAVAEHGVRDSTRLVHRTGEVLQEGGQP
ncbi:hypothetical protein SF12_02345 [Streptomyces sp. MBRL 601]|nr:hypothetical protein SF12_02345 [Streptomyces sp. MBRL 601]